MSDYISREAFKGKYLCCGYLPEMPEKEFDEFPAADVEPVRHGRWEHDGPSFRGGVDWWHCSECERLVSGVENRYSYCPYCGAKMDGGGEDA